MDAHPTVRKRLAERNAVGARIRPATEREHQEWVAMQPLAPAREP